MAYISYYIYIRCEYNVNTMHITYSADIFLVGIMTGPFFSGIHTSKILEGVNIFPLEIPDIASSRFLEQSLYMCSIYIHKIYLNL